jgi:hypothetical protein
MTLVQIHLLLMSDERGRPQGVPVTSYEELCAWVRDVRREHGIQAS